jgi:glycosyltransferase involved in cell wall biosynthesis
MSPRPGSPLAGAMTEFRLDEFEHVTFHTIDAEITPYQTPEQFSQMQVQRGVKATAVPSVEPASAPAAKAGGHTPQPASRGGDPYGGNLFDEIQRYAVLAAEVARQENFDVVHAHDWMTFPAGMAVAALKGVPLVVHVHSTEFDRSGEHVNQRIYDIERRGMHAAMKIIAVSHLTRSLIMEHYGISPQKVEVVYNAIESNGNGTDPQKYNIARHEKIVLFLGRITMQKGPEYFLAAAKKVLEVMDNVKFVMAGSGDMIRRTIEMAAAMGIGHKVLFTGFLRGGDVGKVFEMADLYVMPSVSEPFGIAPLEAMSHDVPVIISKQSGVSEVLTHALKVDFWDIDEMANKIIAVLRHPPLASTLRQHGSFEVRRLNWADSAKQCVEVYEKAIGGLSGSA